MKVGDYVRTKEGLIRKIVETDKLIYIDKDYISDEPEYHNSLIEEDVIKTSPNIIVLIEVGDYVNGSLVSYIGSDCIEVFWYKDEKQWLDKEDIKSIVTKEQFERMKYEVGD